MRLWTLAMVGPKVAFGLYVVIHGQLTPGGGFQGGVILASVALIIYLGQGFDTFKRIMTHPLVEIGRGRRRPRRSSSSACSPGAGASRS